MPSKVENKRAWLDSEAASATWAAGFLTVVSIGVGVTNLLFNVIVARSGGASAYGGIGALLALVTGGGFLAMGLQYSVARRAATTPQAGIFLRSLARQVVPWLAIALTAIVAAPAIASFLHLTNTLSAITAAIMITVVIALSIPTGILIGQKRFGAIALLMALPAVIRLLLTVPLGHMKDPILGALFATALPGLLALFVAAWIVMRVVVPARVLSTQTTHRDADANIVGESTVGALLAATIWAVWSLPLFLGRHYLSPSESGDLAAAQLFAGGVILVTGAVVTAFFPSIARAKTKGMVLTGLSVTTVLALAGAAVIVGLLPLAIPRLYGTDFAIPLSLVGALGVSLAAVAMANYLLWATRALQNLVTPMAVGCVLALIMEGGIGTLWHTSSTVLAFEPGLCLVVGLAGGLTITLVNSLVNRSRNIVVASPQPQPAAVMTSWQTDMPADS